MENSRESESAVAPLTAAKEDHQPKKLPKGIVLGKDGKPCRNCTSFAAWAAMTKENVRQNELASSNKTSVGDATRPSKPRSDCPPDVEALGRGTWTLLHSIAASYPDSPSTSQQSDLLRFVKLFSKLYPCWVCAEDFRTYIGREVPRVGSRDDFGKWLCGAHNDVNRKLGKPEFDCSRWQERWRTGWKDGRCD
ncbi:augmenter of liver regeneration [Metarhizium album ARSEF 1941]|uniref:Sulfhydryl oxidase n=1 Tax=Metarhizium album (strain ARSEF 1941) TaxID=1081103 RepID=A0A0B2X411_METAS|nr:augmenter of liver regeneration [Metarhizium album ARSEF 1941]KHO01094.1 augmenter of liver regeneration [Metarhizium album ARSEF 1941]